MVSAVVGPRESCQEAPEYSGPQVTQATSVQRLLAGTSPIGAKGRARKHGKRLVSITMAGTLPNRAPPQRLKSFLDQKKALLGGNYIVILAPPFVPFRGLRLDMEESEVHAGFTAFQRTL